MSVTNLLLPVFADFSPDIVAVKVEVDEAAVERNMETGFVHILVTDSNFLFSRYLNFDSI